MINFQEFFEYKDGSLYWKKTIASRAKKGNKAGSLYDTGYLMVGIKGKYYAVHRIIFMMQNGYLPIEVDHIDGNKLNNKIENLRPATVAQNAQNRKLVKTNTSGVKNVSWSKVRNKWVVSILCNNSKNYIGAFDDLELADLVAQEARNKYHGSYARHF
jgi:hypothetical protein